MRIAPLLVMLLAACSQRQPYTGVHSTYFGPDSFTLAHCFGIGLSRAGEPSLRSAADGAFRLSHLNPYGPCTVTELWRLEAGPSDTTLLYRALRADGAELRREPQYDNVLRHLAPGRWQQWTELRLQQGLARTGMEEGTSIGGDWYLWEWRDSLGYHRGGTRMFDEGVSQATGWLSYLITATP